MSFKTRESGCIIVQSDLTVLLETDHPLYEDARDALSGFAEMVKSPEYIHTYKLTQLSLWNAAAAGITTEQVIEELRCFSKHEPPQIVISRILDWGKRYGRVKLLIENGRFILRCDDKYISAELENTKAVAKYLTSRLDDLTFEVDAAYRGHIKQALIIAEYPAEDLAGYREASPLVFGLRNMALSEQPFVLRPYQSEAAEVFHANGEARGGHGVIVLPCGAGKTIVGMAAMTKLQTETLILTTAITAVRQWIAELTDKTSLTADQIGEYSGEKKEIKPVTISTYQILGASERHRELMNSREWGLIIYDEVHTLPAPVFRMTAELQSKRRLGLTATLIREDGLESDVFTLIGPKRYEVPWKVLEKSGYIAKAECFEVRVPLADSLRMDYAVADKRKKFRIAAENPGKLQILQRLLKEHSGRHILVIGLYISQLTLIAEMLDAPIITGKTKSGKRDELYQRFRDGEFSVIIVSKVANYAIDLPDANVAIEISGTFGSRQEEAQRLGRILRPKPGENRAWFYTLVTSDTVEEGFAAHRQLFLAEQGYPYSVVT
ncbi:MAG: helicase-associated domain-containing protein [Clostridiales Family XIII bacterium]|jgi:DNA excision repair protein ERCC-3|nr:helicase-associated domain-containing protein [Clostridiales Family XIII bacterium]